LPKRYVKKQHLFGKLDELFPDENYEVEQGSEDFILTVPRKLTIAEVEALMDLSGT